MSKPTCSAALQRLIKNRSVQYDEILKRYRVTQFGLNDLRVRRVLGIMQPGFGIMPTPPEPLPKEGMSAGVFIRPKLRTKSRDAMGFGFLAAEKKRKLFWKSWLYYITSYAVAHNLLQPKGQLNDILPADLTKIWGELFSFPQEIVVVEYVDTEALFNWLKTPVAKEFLREAVRDFPQEAVEAR